MDFGSVRVCTMHRQLIRFQRISMTGLLSTSLLRVHERLCPRRSGSARSFLPVLDEHRNRKPRVVAKVSAYRKEFKRQTVKNGYLEPPKTLHYATLNLIAYTDDPGFFISSDDREAEFPKVDSSPLCSGLLEFYADSDRPPSAVRRQHWVQNT